MKGKGHTEKHKDIARIDQVSKKTYGWYVRVRFNGKTHSKLFSDMKHGGQDRSLLAAIAWRNAKEKELNKPRTDRSIVTTGRTNVGVVGVRLNEKLNRYEVSWVSQHGKHGKTSVSINRHGREVALRIACEKRKEKEAERLFPKEKQPAK